MKKMCAWTAVSMMLVIFTACGSEEDNPIEDSAAAIEEDVLEDEYNEEESINRIEEDDEDEDESLDQSTSSDVLMHFDDVELTDFDDIDDGYAKTISQEGGIDNVVYYGDNQLLTSEFGKGAYLYDINEGDTVWQDTYFHTEGYLNYRNELLYTNNMQGQIAAVDIWTGDTQRTYEYRTEEDGAAIPSDIFIFDSLLAINFNEMLMGYDLETTEQLWEIEFRTHSNLIEVDHLLMFETFDSDVVALNKDTGEEEWRINEPDSYSSGGGEQPFVVDDTLYIFSDNFADTFKLELYDLTTQNKVDSVELDGRFFAREEPVVAEETIFYSSNTDYTNGDIVALEKSLDRERWRIGSEGYIKQQLLYDNGFLYVIVKPDGEYGELSHLVVIEEESGEIVLRTEIGRFERAMTQHPQENAYIDNGKLHIYLSEGVNKGNFRIYEPTGEINRPFE
ncbi:outer membrane protein assembly factor BamB [Alkalihalobacillus xiaoxiensis]|uniref:Outer membrane protein assembly factor BamB n=1 Tax=Shouchella xiaoxiensis TaxID=766895 RepID=A0ABS2SWK8_9BACI|nr:PQQ-binding-like beta-propeller repeat protein [Shouchella xiaoxiensis]MBM7839916.1 outer membrane protein assembly factor BamB [Shouchella xiaoxiensis]